jgi:hypothetical protein
MNWMITELYASFGIKIKQLIDMRFYLDVCQK